MKSLEQEDQKRKMVELSLVAGKKRWSPRTGFIHLYYEDPENVCQDTIPFVENFLYVHALFRSRLMENMQEAKNLLEKLLPFEVDGNFPVYLHEFPRCVDSQLASRILPALFYLLRDFPSALGDGLFVKLQNVALRITSYLESQQQTLSLPAKARLDAFLQRFLPKGWIPQIPAHWAEFCVCCQMMGYPIDEVAKLWDPNFCVFIGQCKERWQDKKEPMVSLLDLFMGQYYKKMSARALLPNIVHLHASLVYPCLQEPVQQEPSSFKAIESLDKKQPLTLYFGDEQKTHSLVVEAKKGSFEILEREKTGFLLCYHYDEELASEEEAVECALYVDADPLCQIFVGDAKATVFHAQEQVCIFLGGKEIHVQFSSQEGSFMGHISLSNRSFQRDLTAYASHDWKLGWRTIRRPSKAATILRIQIL